MHDVGIRRGVGRDAVPRGVERCETEPPRRRHDGPQPIEVAVPQQVQDRRVFPPLVGDEPALLPHLVEEARADPAATHRDHARVRHTTTVDSMLDEMQELARLQFRLDIGSRVEHERVGVEPHRDIEPAHELAQQHDLVPGRGPARIQPVANFDVFVAVPFGVAPSAGPVMSSSARCGPCAIVQTTRDTRAVHDRDRRPSVLARRSSDSPRSNSPSRRSTVKRPGASLV